MDIGLSIGIMLRHRLQLFGGGGLNPRPKQVRRIEHENMCTHIYIYTTILKYIEYGLHEKCVRVCSKIIFYLLQDGCIYTYKHIQATTIIIRIVVRRRAISTTIETAATRIVVITGKHS